MFATRWTFWGSALTLVGATLLTGDFIRDGSAAQEGPGRPLAERSVALTHLPD